MARHQCIISSGVTWFSGEVSMIRYSLSSVYASSCLECMLKMVYALTATSTPS
jgi:hypothetical protein